MPEQNIPKFTYKDLRSMFAANDSKRDENLLPPDDVFRMTDQDYALDGCPEHTLDVYYPENVKDFVTVVWFHGGGLIGGQKDIPEGLKNSGIAVVTVNYRLLTKADISETIDDAAAAVAWTFNHIAEYGGSTDKIIVSGHSAGGYLTDMIGLNKAWLKKYDIDADRIAALIPFSGQVVTHYNVREKMGLKPTQPIIDEYAPLFFVRPDCPPIVIISGDRNQELYGRYEETAYFWRLFQEVGHKEAYIYELDGFDHGAMVEPGCHILKEYVKKRFKK